MQRVMPWTKPSRAWLKNIRKAVLSKAALTIEEKVSLPASKDASGREFAMHGRGAQVHARGAGGPRRGRNAGIRPDKPGRWAPKGPGVQSKEIYLLKDICTLSLRLYPALDVPIHARVVPKGRGAQVHARGAGGTRRGRTAGIRPDLTGRWAPKCSGGKE